MGDELKWVKTSTHTHQDDRIKILLKQPDGDALVNIYYALWEKAGLCNDGGFVYLSPDLPFTEELLADALDRNNSLIRIFRELASSVKLIVWQENGHLFLPDWAELQSGDKYTIIKAQTRDRVARYRERQKEFNLYEPKQLTDGDGNGNVTVTLRNALDKIRIDNNRKEDRDLFSNNNLMASTAWQSLKENIKDGKMNKSNYRIYIENSYGLDYQDGVFIVAVPSYQVADYLAGTTDSLLERNLCEILELESVTIQYFVTDKLKATVT